MATNLVLGTSRANQAIVHQQKPSRTTAAFVDVATDNVIDILELDSVSTPEVLETMEIHAIYLMDLNGLRCVYGYTDDASVSVCAAG